MREAKADYIDSAGHTLGLGSGDLVDLRIPPFQRGLKWDDERIEEFHDSIIQGWPVGVMVMAVQDSRVIDRKTGQRRISLSLIDGQQRSWALAQLLNNFWTEPWYKLSSPKWAGGQDGSGSIVDAAHAVTELADLASLPMDSTRELLDTISRETAGQTFGDYMDFLENFRAQLGLAASEIDKPWRDAARALCRALNLQLENLKEVPVPVLVLDESLKSQLPREHLSPPEQRRATQGLRPFVGSLAISQPFTQTRHPGSKEVSAPGLARCGTSYPRNVSEWD